VTVARNEIENGAGDVALLQSVEDAVIEDNS
jgi:hypothetical protein